jgi:hypothetical protein
MMQIRIAAASTRFPWSLLARNDSEDVGRGGFTKYLATCIRLG